MSLPPLPRLKPKPLGQALKAPPAPKPATGAAPALQPAKLTLSTPALDQASSLAKQLDSPLIPVRVQTGGSREAVNLANLSQAISNINDMLNDACPVQGIQSAMLSVQQELKQHDYLAEVLLPEEVGTCVKALQVIHKAHLEAEFTKTKPKAKRASKAAKTTKALPPVVKFDLGDLGDFT